jgi:CRISPR system Cascade subunit CasD
MNALVLRLDAPMQSWGESSKFTTRNSLSFPTRSGVLGMLLAAKGVERENSGEELKRLGPLKMTSYGGRKRKAERGLLRDYHTIMGVPNSGGKLDTELTYRYYLTDTVFFVVLEGDKTILSDLERSLRSPKFQLFLGRKCCPPAAPPLMGMFSSKLEAEAEIRKLNRITIEETVNEGEGDPYRDVPICFQKRKYQTRLAKKS